MSDQEKNDSKVAGALREKRNEKSNIDKAMNAGVNVLAPGIGGAALKGLNFFGVSNKTIILIAVGFVLFFMLIITVSIYKEYEIYIKALNAVSNTAQSIQPLAPDMSNNTPIK